MDGLGELGWVPAGKGGVREGDGITWAELRMGPWKVEVAGGEYSEEVGREYSANSGLAFDAVGDCDAKPKPSPGGTGAEKPGEKPREQMTRDPARR
ncbi:hypothetical protein ABT354_30460 [Streptomyces sp. NPDC000594]|uniref:hypothetical protein n=1 Tax=Streptomyces sp. NPDC000594 TaxID=3154261 RepID=UPI003326AC75